MAGENVQLHQTREKARVYRTVMHDFSDDGQLYTFTTVYTVPTTVITQNCTPEPVMHKKSL
jgi:hypothetical protein